MDLFLASSVADADPNPDPDPHVFGASGSGSISRGMDSDPDPALDPDPSVIKQKFRKTLIIALLWLLFDFLSLKNDVKVPSISNMQENFF
jgi:hypothetical protein